MIVSGILKCPFPVVNGDKNMSMCIVLIMGEETYICSESRSSIPDERSGTNPYSHKPNKSIPLSDDFKKIFRIPIEGKTIIGYTTGRNTFGEKTINEIIKNTDYSGLNTPIECCVSILQSIAKNDSKTYVNLFEYKNGILHCVLGEAVFGRISINTDMCETNELKYIYHGPEWTKSLLYSMPFPAYGADEEKRVAINAIYEAAMKVSGTLENTLGGVVRIGKLTPDGFTWLQNGYEL